jgi:hypothetical protein
VAAASKGTVTFAQTQPVDDQLAVEQQRTADRTLRAVSWAILSQSIIGIPRLSSLRVTVLLPAAMPPDRPITSMLLLLPLAPACVCD